jgi:hypothetical protein
MSKILTANSSLNIVSLLCVFINFIFLSRQPRQIFSERNISETNCGAAERCAEIDWIRLRMRY